MRTTIDLPDSLFREVKATAAARGMKLKDFIAAAVRAALYPGEDDDSSDPAAARLHRERMAAWFADMSRDRKQTAPVAPLDRDSLHDRHA